MSLQHSQQFVMMSGSIAQAVPTEPKTTAAMMAKRFMGNLLLSTPYRTVAAQGKSQVRVKPARPVS
jgi:hypothetical protein